MRGASDLLAWLASLGPGARDAAIDDHLGIARDPPPDAPPGDDLVGYHASGVAAIVRALLDVPVAPDDIVVDLGSGLGKVVLLAHLLTGARARGIEIQGALVDRARAAAVRVGADVAFERADARDADLADGTVFFLYAPFTGAALTRVLERMHDVAKRRAIVVCALAIDLDRAATWLRPRASDAFWLTVYDSVVAGVPPRLAVTSRLDLARARAVAFEGGAHATVDRA